MIYMSAYYQKSTKEVCEELSVDTQTGLTTPIFRERLNSFGLNILARAKSESIFDIFLRQFQSPLIYVLIVAASLVLALGDILDAIVIIAVIVINSIVGTIQEGKARSSLARLRNLTRHRALVRRNGEEILISAEEVVPGDILILKAGEKVCADARIIKSDNLKTSESFLTGEALPVEKVERAIRGENLVVGDQKNIVFAATSIIEGYGEAVVFATGASSELGKISRELVETADVPLPLLEKVTKLTHKIALGVFLIAIATLAIGVARGVTFLEILSSVIGMVVSLIPEGLPVAVTIVLARGVWRMAKSHAIIRKMAAVEAMGGADTLLVDKTGTITTGKMVITKILFADREIEVSGKGYSPEGEIKASGNILNSIKNTLSICYLSLKADVVFSEHEGWKVTGDPTEAAIAVLCRKLGLSLEKLSKSYKCMTLNPFDHAKRYIEGNFTRGKETWKVYVGAPEEVAAKIKMNQKFIGDFHRLAKDGFRVVGIAVFGPGKGELFATMLLAIEEEIRPEVAVSIRAAKESGFRVVMLTGDFPQTVRSIAQKVGIISEGEEIMSGKDIEELTPVELAQKIEKVHIFARIAPEHKFKIVRAYQALGRVCAMTGDGVNDASALQAADLGIAIGSGTSVAKDAADIILVDNNFNTIVRAIFEGRAIYLVLKKVILYLFSTSLGEVMVISGSILIGLPLPVVAVQIIWLNFVTDGFFVVALAQDKPEVRLFEKFRESRDLVDDFMIKRIILMGSVMFLSALPVFIAYLENHSLIYARTMALLILAMMQWFNALNVRSRRKSVFTKGVDVYIMISFVIVFVLQILVIETSLGNQLLHTVNLTFSDWLLAIAVSTSIIWVEEARKLLGILKSPKKHTRPVTTISEGAKLRLSPNF